MNIRHLISILRYPCLFIYLKSKSKNIRLGPNGHFARPDEVISFGDNIYIGPYFYISPRNLKIGSNVLIGPSLLLEGEDHIYSTPGKTLWEMRRIKLKGFNTIENDVWIGGNVTILKNVTIREGSIVGAGSIVSRSLPPYSICVGSPCKPIKPRFTVTEMKYHLSKVITNYTFEQIIDFWYKSGLL